VRIAAGEVRPPRGTHRRTSGERGEQKEPEDPRARQPATTGHGDRGP
jgi:hypothetical protein